MKYSKEELEKLIKEVEEALSKDFLRVEADIDPISTSEQEYFDPIDPSKVMKFYEIEIKCECGSDKCDSPIHSDWCPKYE